MKWVEDALHIHSVIAKGWPLWGPEDKRFLTLGLCGEVGELANLTKKDWRDNFVGGRTKAIGEELADIRIYLELVATAYGIDLNAVCSEKVKELYRRWPEAKR
jgi:NTP pyrophosphatase (non-canonical NTP hydrolase)